MRKKKKTRTAVASVDGEGPDDEDSCVDIKRYTTTNQQRSWSEKNTRRHANKARRRRQAGRRIPRSRRAPPPPPPTSQPTGTAVQCAPPSPSTRAVNVAAAVFHMCVVVHVSRDRYASAHVRAEHV